MSNPKCAICNKTAYPLESVTALDKAYHKGCFKCSVCNATLNLKNFKGVDGKIFCATHTPKPTATAVTDSIAVKQAVNAPKKSAEGLGHAQKGTGEKASVGLDSIVTQNALKAPRKIAEGARGVQKGTGGKPNFAVFGANAGGEAQAQESGQAYEQPSEEHQYTEEQQQYSEEPQYTEEQQYEEQQTYGEEGQQYEEQQAYGEEGQQYEEQPAEEEQQW